ncbi:MULTISPECIES: PH domain-containing protein [Shewanella]|uniref:PH domain-containing protein n=1 Tax=Shewanella metallivivens TaxID=2872342 RepID=A0ABT5TK66_9GAMM|nr:PH domain-containing protein [Shewanella metallivivens]MDD8058862.1 PH domain-containing protein [Shewanella metallivivens]
MKIDSPQKSQPIVAPASELKNESAAELTPYQHGHILRPAQYIPLSRLALQGVDANYPKLLLIISITITVLITLVITIFGLINPDIPTSVTLSILPGYALLAVIIIKLIHTKAKRIAYGVFEHELVLREGLFWVSTTALPYTRLQHVNLSQGPAERKFNLVSLKCFSAGSGVAEIDLPGLNAELAEHLRQHLLAKAAASHQPMAEQHNIDNDSPLENDTQHTADVEHQLTTSKAKTSNEDTPHG